MDLHVSAVAVFSVHYKDGAGNGALHKYRSFKTEQGALRFIESLKWNLRYYDAVLHPPSPACPHTQPQPKEAPITVSITTRTAKVTTTANQWELYTHAHPAECDRVANRLNYVIETAVAEGLDRRDVERRAHAVMTEEAKYGASDSEPYWRLERILDKIFGEGA